MSKLKKIKEEASKAKQALTDFDELLKTIDSAKPVFASLTFDSDKEAHMFAVIDSSGSTRYVIGEGSGTDQLARLAEVADGGLNIGIVADQNWPPCFDPPRCMPDLVARQQQSLGLFVDLVRRGVSAGKPPR